MLLLHIDEVSGVFWETMSVGTSTFTQVCSRGPLKIASVYQFLQELAGTALKWPQRSFNKLGCKIKPGDEKVTWKHKEYIYILYFESEYSQQSILSGLFRIFLVHAINVTSLGLL